MVKKLLLTLALSGSGTIFAEPHDLVFDVCNKEFCRPYFDGKITDFVKHPTFAGFEPKKIPKKVKPQVKEFSFISFLAGATGYTIQFVSEAFSSIKSTVLDSGYEKFTGKLEGPEGSVEFEYNFKTDKWKLTNE